MARRKRTPHNPALAAYQQQVRETEDAKKRDRKSRDLLRNAQVAVMEIRDDAGDKVDVIRSLRDDPLARLHDRRQIDEAQYQGGRAFQDDFETIQSRPQAVDASQPYVDRSFRHRGISDGYSKALDRLNLAHTQLGHLGSVLARAVLIDGMTMEEVALSRGLTGKSWIEYYGKRFRECLDCLAVVYKFASEGKR